MQSLLEQMQSRFEQMSEAIIGRIDEMGGRIDDLEGSIAELMAQAGVEDKEGAADGGGVLDAAAADATEAEAQKQA